MELAIAVLGLGLQDSLGMTFGAGVTLWAVWCLYHWEIKPNREARRQRRQKQIEERHRLHWQQRAGTRVQRN